MATTTKKAPARKAPARKAPAKKAAAKPSPVSAITETARDLEHNVEKALRSELANLKKLVNSLHGEAHDALVRIERALDGAKPKKATRATKATKATRATKATATVKKTAAKRPTKK